MEPANCGTVDVRRGFLCRLSSGRTPRARCIAACVFASALGLGSPGEANEFPFVRGDANDDGRINLTDGIFILNYLFMGGPEPACLDAADVNDDGGTAPSLTDAVYLLHYLFASGPMPVEPFPYCGPDPTPDGMGCDWSGPCCITAPILFAIQGGDSTLCGGEVITLQGVNFSPILGENEVTFDSGTVSIPGIVLDVQFPAGDLPCLKDSLLQVLVPTGLRFGNMELLVRGIWSGAVGYSACPAVYGFVPGHHESSDAGAPLSWAPEEAFLPGNPDSPEILLQGINFHEIERVEVVSAWGTILQILPNTIERIPGLCTPPDTPPPWPTFLSNIAFGVWGNPGLLALGTPDTLRIEVLTYSGRSNPVYVPVRGDKVAPLGPVVNGLRLDPTYFVGVPLRFEYSLYDRPADCAYDLAFEWTPDGGQSWFPAAPAAGADPIQGVVPGLLQSAGGLCAEGKWLAFLWDPEADPVFRNLASGKRWSLVAFRASASSSVPACSGRISKGPFPLLETPPILYFRG